MIAVPENVARDWLIDRVCVLNLVVRTDGTVVPTAVGYVFFALEPARRVKSACDDVFVVGGKTRTIKVMLCAQRGTLALVNGNCGTLKTIINFENRPLEG